MSLTTDALTIVGLLLDLFGALVMVTPDSERLSNSLGRIFWQTHSSYNEFLSLEYEHILLMGVDETYLPALLISVFDLEYEPSDIERVIKDNPGKDANLSIKWSKGDKCGSYTTSYERAKDKVETTVQRRYLLRGAVFLIVGFGLQIVATFL